MNEKDRYQELIACFAPTVGVERSEEVVTAAALEVGVDVEELSEQGALSILTALTRHAGIVGIAARFATSRRAFLPQSIPRAAPATESGRAGLHRRELLALLEGSMDPSDVGSVLDEAWRSAGIAGDRCPADRVTAVLDALVRRGGSLAVAATFAKARWHLRTR